MFTDLKEPISGWLGPPTLACAGEGEIAFGAGRGLVPLFTAVAGLPGSQAGAGPFDFEGGTGAQVYKPAGARYSTRYPPSAACAVKANETSAAINSSQATYTR